MNHSPPVRPHSGLGTASPLVLLLCAPILFGCAVTQIMTDVDRDPLPAIAERAAERYTVTWLDKQTLEVTDDWDSTLTMFVAELHYTGGALYGQFYVHQNNPLTLFIPTYSSAEWSESSPAAWNEMWEFLGWAGVDADDVNLEHVSVSCLGAGDVRDLVEPDS